MVMKYEEKHFIDKRKLVWSYSLFSDETIELYQSGNLCDGYDYFGSHPLTVLNTDGCYFAVWAPNAKSVSVTGDFNGWKGGIHKLYIRQDGSGIWEGFIPKILEEHLYKYCIVTKEGKEVFKADPYAFAAELRPSTASKIKSLRHDWQDEEWMKKRSQHNSLDAPWSVYEIQLASWMRPVKDDESAYTSYLDLIDRLVPYVTAMGFTHVEFMPVMEYPFDGSWGYQGTGFFAATSRFGTPQEFMQLIDALHQNNIGVVLDWVPSHFPSDAHGLYLFDGTPTYEYADHRKGFHIDWNSYIFDYARMEVVSFLKSSAHFWLQYYHADGIRVDAVNSIIRLDFSRKEGEWLPNMNGGNENLEAIKFLQELNVMVAKEFPCVQMIAEEASDWKGITAPVAEGGFGFGMKWMMGWMHDNFSYFKKGSSERLKHQQDFTFSIMYAFNENYMLPLSHDEVVHGKSPMIYKMPGNEWEKFANLRLLYSWMYLHPGAKLLFMGNEFAQTSEWNYKTELQWELLEHKPHSGMQACVRRLNELYRSESVLHEGQFEQENFEWVTLAHEQEGIMAFERRGKKIAEKILVVLNVSDSARSKFKLVVQGKSAWREIFNSDDEIYWGSSNYLNSNIRCVKQPKKENIYNLFIDMAPFSALVLK